MNNNTTFERNNSCTCNQGGKVQPNARHRGNAPYGNRQAANRFGGTARGQGGARQGAGAANRPGGGAGTRPGGGGAGTRPGGGAGTRPGGGAGTRPGGGVA